MTTVYNLKRETWFNPWFVGGCQVSKIYFYNETGIVLSHSRGWLSKNNNTDPEFLAELPICKATKESFDKKRHFFITGKAKYNPNDKEAHLYLYIPDIPDFKDLGCRKTTESDFAVFETDFYQIGEREFFTTPFRVRSEKTENIQSVEKARAVLKELYISDLHQSQILALINNAEKLAACK